jgi:hypothetical protein
MEQFTLAKQISDKVSVANEAVLRIRSLKDQVADRVQRARGQSTTSSRPSTVWKRQERPLPRN